eukprot:scaffold1643_cov390-Prasinococcus_capsulatus_cf.AAC.3
MASVGEVRARAEGAAIRCNMHMPTQAAKASTTKATAWSLERVASSCFSSSDSGKFADPFVDGTGEVLVWLAGLLPRRAAASAITLSPSSVRGQHYSYDMPEAGKLAGWAVYSAVDALRLSPKP